MNDNNSLIEQVIVDLSDKLGCNVQFLSENVLGGGCINHASKIITNQGDFFLKWNANCAEDIFLREAESLEELGKAVGRYLIVPKVFAAKRVDEIPGFLVLEYLKPQTSISSFDEKLGRGLATLHQNSNSKFGFHHNNYCGATPQNNKWEENWPEFFSDNRILFLLKLIQNKRSLTSSEIKIYDKLLFKIPDLIPKESIPVIIHGDLWSGNYMNTENGPALIDPASYFADREMEFGIMTMFGGFSSRFFSAYNEINPLPADWKERNLLYQLYHVLNHYFLFGGGYGSQALNIAKRYL